MTLEAQTPGALCAVHPDRPALQVCQRCGYLACDLCSEDGRHEVCAACRSPMVPTAFPFTRDRWSLADLLGYTWQVFKREWVVFVLAGVVLFGISAGVSILSQLALTFAVLPFGDDPAMATVVTVGFMVASTLVDMAVQAWLLLGLFALAFRALHGQPMTLNRLFSQYRKVGKVLLQYLVVALAFGIPGVIVAVVLVLALSGDGTLEAWLTALLGAGAVLVVPAIYVGLGLAFMQAEIAYDDRAGPVEAIRRSWIIVRGHRLWTLLVLLLCSLLSLSGLLACCVGIVATFPLGQLLFAAWYLTLRDGAAIPATPPR